MVAGVAARHTQGRSVTLRSKDANLMAMCVISAELRLILRWLPPASLFCLAQQAMALW